MPKTGKTTDLHVFTDEFRFPVDQQGIFIDRITIRIVYIDPFED